MSKRIHRSVAEREQRFCVTLLVPPIVQQTRCLRWIHHKDTKVLTDTLEYVKHVRPKCGVVENVPGILSKIKNAEDASAAAFLIKELQSMRYHVGQAEIDLLLFHQVARRRIARSFSKKLVNGELWTGDGREIGQGRERERERQREPTGPQTLSDQ